MDAQAEDVLAMASRPDFDPNQPVIDGGSFPANKALKAYFPGSIFKAVIAEAALETGVVAPSDTFECPGHIDIGDGTLNCWTTHGTVTAEEAFAQSCNVAFAQMAMKLGREQIDAYASMLGFGQTVGLSQGDRSPFYGEDTGSVFLKEYSSDRFLANTGIGQEDVRVTPLQAAHLMATIANEGKSGAPRLVQSLHTPDGLLYSEIKTAEKKSVLEKASSRRLKEWMRQVVAADKGTAHILNGAKMAVAGKTGTAQTGDPRLHHQWFAGFAPYEDPKYVIVVMADSVPDGKARANEQVALQIVNALP